MEILKEGKKWSINSLCTGIGINGGGCGAELKIEADDIKAVIKLIDAETPDILYTKRDYCYTFKCPCCNIESEINEEELPIYVKRKALEKVSPSDKKIKVNKKGRVYL